MIRIDHVDEEIRLMMFQHWSRGFGIATIARNFDESREVVEAVIAVAKKNGPNPFKQDPVDVIRNHFIRIDALNEDAATLVREENGATRARGLALQFKLAEHRLDFCQAIGVLPPPDVFRQWALGVELFDRLFALLEDHGVLDDELLDAMCEFPYRYESLKAGDEQA